MSNVSKVHPAEELLIAKGAAERRTAMRRAVLGCIGCQWLRTDTPEDQRSVVYGYDVARCTGLPEATVYAVLRKLKVAGAAQSERVLNPAGEGLPPRTVYVPADTELGRAFVGRLAIPSDCPRTGAAPELPSVP